MEADNITSILGDNKRIDFICEVNHPFVDLPQIQKGIFYCKERDGGGYDQRTELFYKNKLFATFIENKEGSFGIDGDNLLTVRGGEFTSLYTIDFAYSHIDENDMANSSISISSSKVLGEDCLKILIRTPKESSDKKKDKDFLNNKIATYELVCGKYSGMIYSRKEYNVLGKLKFAFTPSRIHLKPDWSKYSGIFDTPKHIDMDAMSEGEFYNLKTESHRLSEKNKNKFAKQKNGIAVFFLEL